MRSQHPGAQLQTGHTPSGHVFKVPPTVGMFEVLVSPTRWGPAELITIFFSLIHLLSIFLIPRLPYIYYLGTFLFWRLAYNIGIAILLYRQSSSLSITKWLSSRSIRTQALLNWATTASLPSSYEWSQSPISFNAWIVFRAFAMLVLTNDGLSYFVLFLASFHPIQRSFFSILSYFLFNIPLAIALVALSFWSKAAAHNVLSDFAWYWGDFFFTIDANLVFDGVFNLFPHPMYTVGYAAYYGAALLSRSYSLLLVSLFAHLLQIAFLIVVEEPHIHKTYGSSSSTTQDEGQTSRQTGMPSNSAIDSNNTNTSENFVRDFVDAAPSTLFRYTLLFLVVILGVLSAMTSFARASFILFPLVVLCRVTHWSVLAYLLTPGASPSSQQPRLFTFVKGIPQSAIYSSFQHALFLSTTLNHFLFWLAAVHTPSTTMFSCISSVRGLSATVLGITIMIGSACALHSIYHSLGPLHSSYGPLLHHVPGSLPTPTGVFFYLSHPRLVLPYLIYISLALMRRSTVLAFLAITCLFIHLLFNRMVMPTSQVATSPSGTSLENAILSLPGIRSVFNAALLAMDTLAGTLMNVLSTARVPIGVERVVADVQKVPATIHRVVTDVTDKAASEAERGLPDVERVFGILSKAGVTVSEVKPPSAE